MRDRRPAGMHLSCRADNTKANRELPRAHAPPSDIPTASGISTDGKAGAQMEMRIAAIPRRSRLVPNVVPRATHFANHPCSGLAICAIPMFECAIAGRLFDEKCGSSTFSAARQEIQARELWDAPWRRTISDRYLSFENDHQARHRAGGGGLASAHRPAIPPCRKKCTAPLFFGTIPRGSAFGTAAARPVSRGTGCS